MINYTLCVLCVLAGLPLLCIFWPLGLALIFIGVFGCKND